MSEKKQTPKEELQILKEKYAIAKTTLEAVLWYFCCCVPYFFIVDF